MALLIATQEQADRFRNDLAASEAVFGDEEVDEIFSMATSDYPDDTPRMITRTRIIGIRRLLANAAKLVTYTQNASEEVLSDVSKNLRALLKEYTDELNATPDTSSDATGPVRFGTLRKVDRINKEFPRA